MKLNDVIINSCMIRVLDIIAPVLEKDYPDAEISIENCDVCFSTSSQPDWVDGNLDEIQERLEKYMPLKTTTVNQLENCVKIHVLPFFEDEMAHNAHAIRKAVLHAVNDSIPTDNKLNNACAGTFELYSEGGIGFRAEDGPHMIDFKVEGIEYEYDAYYDYTTPTMWYAHGYMDDFNVELVAGSEAHAFAKIIKAFYKKALKVDPFFATEIKNNEIQWTTYGYCY